MANQSTSNGIQELISLAQQGKLITDLDEMRNVARHVLLQKRSETTKDKYWGYYLRNIERMLSEATETDQTMHEYIESLPRSKSTKNWLAAMFQYSACTHLAFLMKEIREARRRSDKNRGRLVRKHASELIHQVLLMAPDYTKSHWRNRTHEGEGFSESGRKSKKKRKRRGLRYLPLDWRSKVAHEVRPKFRLFAGIQAVSGCRTKELENGVEVWTENERIHFRINGAKTNQGHGQKWRMFSVCPSSSNLANSLYLQLKNEPRKVQLSLDHPDAYRKHISAAARAAGLDRVSPISFRHQMASDLKSGGYSSEKIAMIMGHCSDLTAAKHYGLKHSGRYVEIEDVKSAQKVRIHDQQNSRNAANQRPSPS